VGWCRARDGRVRRGGSCPRAGPRRRPRRCVRHAGRRPPALLRGARPPRTGARAWRAGIAGRESTRPPARPRGLQALLREASRGAARGGAGRSPPPVPRARRGWAPRAPRRPPIHSARSAPPGRSPSSSRTGCAPARGCARRCAAPSAPSADRCRERSGGDRRAPTRRACGQPSRPETDRTTTSGRHRRARAPDPTTRPPRAPPLRRARGGTRTPLRESGRARAARGPGEQRTRLPRWCRPGHARAPPPSAPPPPDRRRADLRPTGPPARARRPPRAYRSAPRGPLASADPRGPGTSPLLRRGGSTYARRSHRTGRRRG